MSYNQVSVESCVFFITIERNFLRTWSIMITCYVRTYSFPYSEKSLNYFRGIFRFLIFLFIQFRIIFSNFIILETFREKHFMILPWILFLQCQIINLKLECLVYDLYNLKIKAFYQITIYIILHNVKKHICRKMIPLFIIMSFNERY